MTEEGSPRAVDFESLTVDKFVPSDETPEAVPLVVLERDYTIHASNKPFRELTCMNENELAGRSFSDLAKDLWGFKGVKEKLEKLFGAEPGTLLAFEHPSDTSQNKILLIKAQALPIEKSRMLLLTVKDVTLRRKTKNAVSDPQAELQHLVESKDHTLSRAREQLRNLAAHLFTMQEEERQRVARELHDDISQRLSLLEFLCAKAEDNDEQALHAIRKEVESLNTDVREISHRLHPAILSHLGLPTALKSLVDDFREREQMPATYSALDVPKDHSQTVTTAMYRIAQEALRNVSKHAGKTHVKISLEKMNNALRLQVRDFGTGFDQDADYPVRGLGLISMEERARIADGVFTISSSLGNGTHVIVDIPLEQHE